MKRIFLIGLLISGLLASYSYAQMGGQKGDIGPGMMERGQMMSNMADMMNQMAGMMENMAGMIKVITKDRTKAASEMMEDMAKQMTEMSKIMERGMALEKEMKTMQDRMIEFKKRMGEMHGPTGKPLK